MKGYIFTIALALLSTIATSQVGVGTNTIDPSAMLQVESSDKGFLPPRMTTVQRNNITSPAEGLLIFNTETDNFEFSDGTNWISLADGSTLAAINTASASGTGDLGIGITTPDATAAVDVVSTTRGFLPPRVTTAQRNAIVSPSEGLLIYNVENNDLEYSDGTNWISLKDGTTLAAVSTTGSVSGSGVGIGTNNPHPSAVLDVESSTRGFLPPRMNTTDRDDINAGTPAPGIIIYNSDEKCLEVYTGADWYNMCNPLITDLDCDNATLSGSLTENEDATGENFVVDYTNGNGKSYPSQSVASTGVMGLTADLSAGTLASGNGSVTYTISGTPTGSGTASFAISLGGQSCTVDLTVFPQSPITGYPGAPSQCTSATISATPCAAVSGATENDDNTTADGTEYDWTDAATSGMANTGSTRALVDIGGQCWMRYNMDVMHTTGNSVYYPGGPYTDEGRLYSWDAAMGGLSTNERGQGICPSGWHVPSDCEWMYLENNLGMSTFHQGKDGQDRNSGTVGSKLANFTSGGNNSSGFSALATGWGNPHGEYRRGLDSGFWTSTEFDANHARRRQLESTKVGVVRGSLQKTTGLWPIRCIKD